MKSVDRSQSDFNIAKANVEKPLERGQSWCATDGVLSVRFLSDPSYDSRERRGVKVDCGMPCVAGKVR